MDSRSAELKVAVVTLFPEMFAALTGSGISRRAVESALVELKFFNPRAYTTDKHQTVDDRPYGGGPGMVMRVEPLVGATEAALSWLDKKRDEVCVVYLSPQGKPLNKTVVASLSAKKHLVLVCGRYEGIDERFVEAYVDTEISIGDYVLSGGELPAMVMLDALIRRLPGALGDAQSAEQDSFEEGLLDCPHYTRPDEVLGKSVPAVLMSGDHKKIREWRLEQSLSRTRERRPDLFEVLELSDEQSRLLKSTD